MHARGGLKLHLDLDRLRTCSLEDDYDDDYSLRSSSSCSSAVKTSASSSGSSYASIRASPRTMSHAQVCQPGKRKKVSAEECIPHNDKKKRLGSRLDILQLHKKKKEKKEKKPKKEKKDVVMEEEHSNHKKEKKHKKDAKDVKKKHEKGHKKGKDKKKAQDERDDGEIEEPQEQEVEEPGRDDEPMVQPKRHLRFGTFRKRARCGKSASCEMKSRMVVVPQHQNEPIGDEPTDTHPHNPTGNRKHSHKSTKHNRTRKGDDEEDEAEPNEDSLGNLRPLRTRFKTVSAPVRLVASPRPLPPEFMAAANPSIESRRRRSLNGKSNLTSSFLWNVGRFVQGSISKSTTHKLPDPPIPPLLSYYLKYLKFFMITRILTVFMLTVVGNYIVGEELGTGGFGVVKRAMQRTTGRLVAVKIVQKVNSSIPPFVIGIPRHI